MSAPAAPDPLDYSGVVGLDRMVHEPARLAILAVLAGCESADFQFLLAATGLQGGWADVPPAHVEAIVAALVACGRMTEARLFAAEAVTRTA